MSGTEPTAGCGFCTLKVLGVMCFITPVTKARHERGQMIQPGFATHAPGWDRFFRFVGSERDAGVYVCLHCGLKIYSERAATLPVATERTHRAWCGGVQPKRRPNFSSCSICAAGQWMTSRSRPPSTRRGNGWSTGSRQCWTLRYDATSPRRLIARTSRRMF